MRPDEMRAERKRFESWMVKVAALEMNSAEMQVYDRVKAAADWLYTLERLAGA